MDYLYIIHKTLIYFGIPLLLFCLPRIAILVKQKLKKTYTGEDLYQYKKYERTGNSYIYNYNQFRVFNPLTLNRLEKYYSEYRQRYSLPYMYSVKKVKNIGGLQGLINHKPEESEHMKLVHSDNEVGMFLDHVYLGAEFFNCVGQILYEACTKPVISFLPSFPLRDLASWKFIIQDYTYPKVKSLITKANDHPKDLVLEKHKTPCQMTRMYKINSIEDIKAKYSLSDGNQSTTMFKVLFQIYQELFERLPKEKTLIKSYVTYAFRGDTTVYNNIGVVFVNVSRSTSFDKFVRSVEKKKYQAVATNYLMKLSDSSGKGARNSVDVVISISKFNEVSNIPVKAHFTFGSNPDYPIYCLSISLGEEQHLSITSNTPSLKLDKVLD